MQYGICPLSIVPVRDAPDSLAPMISQLLFGELYKVLETRKHWSKIRNAFDKNEGWIANQQLHFITQEEYAHVFGKGFQTHSTDLVSYVLDTNNRLVPLVLGSSLEGAHLLCMQHDGSASSAGANNSRDALIKTALLYLNAPELAGGKTPFGIDASGFAQMVYRIHGYPLLRRADEQSAQGMALSFVEESEPGDLAFFDNASGVIDHVGIIMDNNYIIHVNGWVRIDRLDHTGIYNYDLRNYSHSLRVIKKIIP
jgi:gamma-D-glutamyl-L-lysine dipeptidyl-peptidase